MLNTKTLNTRQERRERKDNHEMIMNVKEAIYTNSFPTRDVVVTDDDD